MPNDSPEIEDLQKKKLELEIKVLQERPHKYLARINLFVASFVALGTFALLVLTKVLDFRIAERQDTIKLLNERITKLQSDSVKLFNQKLLLNKSLIAKEADIASLKNDSASLVTLNNKLKINNNTLIAKNLSMSTKNNELDSANKHLDMLSKAIAGTSSRGMRWFAELRKRDEDSLKACKLELEKLRGLK